MTKPDIAAGAEQGIDLGAPHIHLLLVYQICLTMTIRKTLTSATMTDPGLGLVATMEAETLLREEA